MGTISVNKLGGLALVIGPLVTIISYLIRPGGGLVGGNVDPADATASIGSLLANSDMASISFFLIPVGLILFVYGLSVLVDSLKGGNGEALSRLAMVVFLFAAVGWITSSAITLVVAGGNAGPAAGALYATSLGINVLSSILGGLAFLCLGLAVSTRDDFNKMFAVVATVAAAVLFVAAVIAGRDISQLQTVSMISSVGYIVLTAWMVTQGYNLLKKG